ncbi:hypothetical protein CEXT_676461 [Caerostris extrusa]|uniref:Uncharacterized protein n=1 Tax=Caerostris extrusa TaxID=172846 RepID=A0AAV4S9V2_CAEEX|nr:hypothetical protein CEXT_676461 [Caerostris extrusa]
MSTAGQSWASVLPDEPWFNVKSINLENLKPVFITEISKKQICRENTVFLYGFLLDEFFCDFSHRTMDVQIFKDNILYCAIYVGVIDR